MMDMLTLGTIDDSAQAEILGAAGVVQWEFDRTRDVFTSVSGPAVELLGFPIEAWGEPGFWVERLHPDDVSWVPAHFRGRMDDRPLTRAEYRMLCADGRTVRVRDVTLVQSPDAPVGHVRGVFIPLDGAVRSPMLLSEDQTARRHELAEGLSLGAYEIMRDGTVLWMNRVAATLLECECECDRAGSARLCDIWACGDAALSAEIDSLLERAMAAGGGEFEASVAGEDASPTVLRANVSCIQGDGSAAVFLLLAEDFTRQDTHRRKSDELDVIVRLLGDLYFRVSADGVCVDCREPVDSAFRIPEGGFIGRTISDSHSPVVARMIQEAVTQTLDTGQVVVFEIQFNDGEATRTLEARALPAGGDEAIVVVRDITARIENERRLSVSEARLRSVLNGLPSGLHLWRAVEGALILVAANPAADEILGIEHDALLGLDLADAFPPSAEQGLGAVYRRIAIEGGAWENSHIDYDDGEIAGAFEVQAFQSAPREVAVLFTEVTERERVAAQERAHRDRLQALAAEITTLEDRERLRLAEELHDCVTQPLAVSRMKMRQAQSEEFPASGSLELQQALELMDTAIKETRALTTRLFPPVLHELGLPTAIRWLCEESERLLSIECRADVRLGPDLSLEEHRQILLFRAARELLANVQKHADASRAVITVEQEGNEIVLAVEDDGSGFAHGVARSDSQSGFGLFSLGERIRYLGGSLEIGSADMGGAAVTVRLPLS